MRFFASILAIVALIVGAAGTQAQDSTGTDFPYSPVLEDCQIGPRSADEVLTLTSAGESVEGAAAASSATSEDASTPVVDTPGDQALATIRELAACIAADDMLRTFALFSDGYIERLQERTGPALEDDLLLNAIWATQGQFFLGDDSWASTLAGYLEASGTASPQPAPGVTGSMQAVPAVWELGADRIAAAVTMAGLACFMQCDYVLVFIADDDSGRYLIDDAIELFDLSEVPSG
jgi:hypothetical protein